ncbi:protein IIIa [Southern Psittacara leucophthalmus aviadenovirus]|uniref:Protein IIIa n=1 Tax=Southern Psittacara leucophthalmus aviadenovirus TaxID=2604330 RepID=A0AAE6ISK1_9ADEN|nr:protein IIIa [Southern Psittacara leucophthalmus aviadenovirus]QEJ80770.1 protein IIIa [Southern Psittacara leucophthalmus aviadenovirus]
MTTTDSFKFLAPQARLEVAGALSNTHDNKDARSLRHAPYANRLISLQTAVVPPKVDGTSERVAEIVKGLAKQGAIYPDQMGAIHSDLLNRAYTWNSMGVQESIQALVNDVMRGQSRQLQEELSRTKEIANASMLTQFFNSLYKTVERGQRNFEGFKRLLRLFINNVPNCEIYKSGDSFSLQMNLGGNSQNINLTNAFENLKDIWGAKWDSVNNPRIGALMTPNTLSLIFFVSAFYDHGVLQPGSYLDNIMRLYKETVKADIDADGDVVMELGDAGANLNKRFSEYKDTLNYLIQNRRVEGPAGPLEMSEEQEMLFGYMMRLLRQALKDGVPSDMAVSTMVQFIDPVLYQTNKVMIEKLQTYLLEAHARNPHYYAMIVMDRNWRPPASILTGNYVIPDRFEMFDDGDSVFDYVPSRDEFIDDAMFQPPPRVNMSADQEKKLREDLEFITSGLDQNVGVQSEAGWLTDHRLPGLLDGALNVSDNFNVALPPDYNMSSRRSSTSSAMSMSGSGGLSFFDSLKPSVGSKPSSRALTRAGLSGEGARQAAYRDSMRKSALLARAKNPNSIKNGKRLRFY